MTQNKERRLRPVGGEYAGPLSVQWLAAMPLGCLLSARRTAFRSISSLNFDLLPILSNDLGDRLLALLMRPLQDCARRLAWFHRHCLCLPLPPAHAPSRRQSRIA